MNFENEGGEGSAGAHWERSILMNEMMTASDIASPRISEFTLALMQDSGWYEVDFNLAENFTYYKNVGCKLDFDVDLIAIQQSASIPPEVSWMPKECSTKNKRGCFYDYTHQALCYKDPFFGNPNSGISESYISSTYRFFGMSNDSCVSKNQQKNYELFGEAYGSSERCFVGSLMREGKF